MFYTNSNRRPTLLVGLLLTAVAVVVALLVRNQSPISQSTSDASLSLEQTAIPFTLNEAHNMCVQAEINDAYPVTLMFHTAVDSVSLTNEALTKMPRLRMDSSVEVESWGGKSKAGVSTGNKIQIGALTWENQSIFSDEYSGPETDGKFGPNFFQGKILEIDFDNSQLIVHTQLPTKLAMGNSDYQKLDFVEKQGCMYVVAQLEIAGVYFKNEFMLHSGFGGTLLLDDAFVSTHKLGTELKTISERKLKDSFGNVLTTKKVSLEALQLGGSQFRDVPVEIFDEAIGNQKVSVLGCEILRRFNWVFDFANRQVYLRPSNWKLAETH